MIWIVGPVLPGPLFLTDPRVDDEVSPTYGVEW
jgi:hypothetical protein